MLPEWLHPAIPGCIQREAGNSYRNAGRVASSHSVLDATRNGTGTAGMPADQQTAENAGSREAKKKN